jgi:hypothetical protein
MLPWLAGAGAHVALLGLVLVLLGPATWLIAGSTVRGIPDAKDRADAINAVRGTLLTASAGIVAVVALYFTGRTFYLSRRGLLHASIPAAAVGPGSGSWAGASSWSRLSRCRAVRVCRIPVPA